MRDKISKIDKLEKSDKAQAIVNRASSGVKAAQKPSKKSPQMPQNLAAQSLINRLTGRNLASKSLRVLNLMGKSLA